MSSPKTPTGDLLQVDPSMAGRLAAPLPLAVVVRFVAADFSTSMEMDLVEPVGVQALAIVGALEPATAAYHSHPEDAPITSDTMATRYCFLPFSCE
jgi:hypothetical protein